MEKFAKKGLFGLWGAPDIQRPTIPKEGFGAQEVVQTSNMVECILKAHWWLLSLPIRLSRTMGSTQTTLYIVSRVNRGIRSLLYGRGVRVRNYFQTCCEYRPVAETQHACLGHGTGISPVPIEREFTREFPTWIHAQLKSWSRLQLGLFIRPSSVVRTSVIWGGWTVRIWTQYGPSRIIIQDSTHDSLNKTLQLDNGVYVVLVLQLWCRWT